MDEFYRIKRLPPYVFAIVNDLKTKARARGEDVIDLGMGNPDMPTPKHIVDKLVEAAKNPKNHRYSASRGITRLRVAMAKWYRDRYKVDLNPDSEVIATIGAKEGMAHLALAVLQPGDGALVPNPTYPIHSYSVVIADGDLRSVPLTPDGDFFPRLAETARLAWPKATLSSLSFPHNPTTMCVERAQAEGHDVRVGSHSRYLPRPGLARVLQALDPGGQGGRVAGHRLRRVRRGLRAVRARRERAADPPGAARAQAAEPLT